MSYRQEQKARDAKDPRGAEMARLLRAGNRTTAIAAKFGLSYDRTKQILGVHVTPAERRAITATARSAAQKERRSVRQFALLMERLTNARPCRVCPGWNLRAPALSTCSPECADAWRVGRFQLDAELHERHRVHQAKAVLANPTKYKESTVRLAERMLSDDPPPPNRRWKVPNSAASLAAQRRAS